MENKSEELARLLGVKVYKYNWCWWESSKYTCKNLKEAISFYRNDVYNESYKFDNWKQLRKSVNSYVKKSAIDFTKPSNFVKLLEIILNNNISVEFDFKHNKDHENVVYFNSGDAQGKNLIDALINYINESVEYYEFEGVEEGINNLKHDLANEEWEY